MKVINFDSPNTPLELLDNSLHIAMTQDLARLEFLARGGVVLEGFCLVYIESGQASFSIDGQTVRCSSGELLYINGGHPVTDIMMSTGLKFRAVYLSYELFDTLVTRLRVSWTLRSRSREFSHVCFRLEPLEGRNICHYYDLLESKRQYTRHHIQTIDSLCEAFGYELLDLMENHELIDHNGDASTTHPNTSADQYFERFVQLINGEEVVVRQVAWYADMLNITPKYLSMICQKVVHESPSAIIERELSQQAIRMLQESSMSVKQISQHFRFANQSHFGTYLKRVTGKGPQEYRNPSSPTSIDEV